MIPEYKKEDSGSLRIRMGQNYRHISNERMVVIGNDAWIGIIKSADYMVVGRNIRFIDRISLAFKYNVKLISGVDNPVFSRQIIEEIEKNT